MEAVLDVDTVDEVASALTRAYAAAVELAAPRIWRRFTSIAALVASDSAEQTISDDEWEMIIGDTEDAVGDAVLDGAIAAAVALGTIAPATLIARRVAEHVANLIQFAPVLRQKIDRWIETTIESSPPDSFDALVELLRIDSPLSTDKAALVASTDTQAAVNGGHHLGLDAAPPAALRWVSQRDTRVRFAHAVADSETVPYGSLFTIGGYPARYPGDPNLPFELRVNCRCELAYVEGNEVRRAVLATKSELRSTAKDLGIVGRSKMNKGELQHAVLKALCLHGLAGGSDCPDKLDQMNRTALLTLARGQGIPGRHRMSRPQLLQAIRGELRGTDPGRVAAGFATNKQTRTALARATAKRRNLPTQDGPGTIPSIVARRAARRDLFDEFADDGIVPCVHCGLRLHWDQRQGFAMLVPEPIVPWSEGGTLDLANLVPSCPSCFRARGGRGLVAAADVPRDAHGKWCKGAQCNADAHTELVFDDPRTMYEQAIFEMPLEPGVPSESVGQAMHDDALAEFQAAAPSNVEGARSWYTVNGYKPINQYLRHDNLLDPDAPEAADNLERGFAYAKPSPHPNLFRGQSKGSMKPMEYGVGDEFVDKGFGSWTDNPYTAHGFAGYDAPQGVFIRLTNAGDERVIPGSGYETEWIVSPGAAYKVTKIVDYVDPGRTRRYRYMEVESIEV